MAGVIITLILVASCFWFFSDATVKVDKHMTDKAQSEARYHRR